MATKAKLKRYNGSAWEQYYPQTTTDQVVGLATEISDIYTDIGTKVSKSGDTMSGTLTIDTGGSSDALVIKGTSPFISLLDDDSGADDFYIHANSNNFYILTDRDGGNQVGTGFESPHPLQLEADTNIGYLFGNRIFADNYHPNADKWTTPRTITLGGDLAGSVSLDGSANVTLSAQVTNDSHDHDGRYYTESEIKTFFNRGYIDSVSGSNLPVGWYTIATNTGDRALGQFQIWDMAGGDHQSVVFNASHHFGVDSSNDITVLANSRYSGTNFRYIRIKDGSTYDGAALQVYIDGSSNAVRAAIVGYNAQESGWVLKNWIPDATDPGDLSSYSSMTSKALLDLDQTVNGGLMTTGQIYAASNQIVWHEGNLDPSSLGGATTENYSGTLSSSGWSGTEPSTQTITISGVTSSDNPTIDIDFSGVYNTDIGRSQEWGKVYRITTSTNSITAYALEAPAVDLPIRLKVVR